jgi:hypothetical protein
VAYLSSFLLGDINSEPWIPGKCIIIFQKPKEKK